MKRTRVEVSVDTKRVWCGVHTISRDRSHLVYYRRRLRPCPTCGAKDFDGLPVGGVYACLECGEEYPIRDLARIKGVSDV